jgi:hypothetical protein
MDDPQMGAAGSGLRQKEGHHRVRDRIVPLGPDGPPAISKKARGLRLQNFAGDRPALIRLAGEREAASRLRACIAREVGGQKPIGDQLRGREGAPDLLGPFGELALDHDGVLPPIGRGFGLH